ncbi:ATP-binding cassette domain-containing protein [Umezawaea endophytica]|uniref:ATP-binding cassette domain-containing protein n=1 Tax=Umezawaea endophytica TaxID=1654476 RepID=A0A9X3A7Y9_9PSEU|nr:ATP-binding cassette domain-containing protein [Umezawaea endophytica]MCS7484873.1 ATP-binding cassette domain-containing protein [Umezawaea endophytica]
MIEAAGLTKHYGPTVAVDDLSFTVEAGRVTGFLGPNGAGKSTTMRMILGLDTPNKGQALIDGKRYSELKRPLGTVGALLDAKWVHPNRSARSHLRWLAKSNHISDKRVDEVLEMVGLTAVAKRNAGGFSLGMAQRLGIAGALLGDPKVLLFDEPVNGLDPEGIVWIRQFMHRLAADGRTVLVSSHLLSEMAQTAHELIVIGKGKLIAQTSTEQFIKDATEDNVRVRSPHAVKLRELLAGSATVTSDEVDGALVVHGLDPASIGDLAAANGIVLHELSPQRGSLEAAFMQLTKESVEYHAAES